LTVSPAKTFAMPALPTDRPMTTLDRLPIGISALVETVQAAVDGSDFDISRRLKELGFVHGEAVKVLHKGYFGGEPIAVRVGQSTFALRKFEAALIGVTQVGNK
jgi:ferrous iron transport protein A